MNANASTTLEATDSAATKVLLVDRSTDVCSDMSNLVNSQEGFKVCAVANEARAGLAAFRQLKPELVITGIAMPGMDGLKMTQLMLAEQPSTKVLIHSVREDVPFGLKALRVGAKGYVRKGGRPSVLVNAMRHVVSQGLYLSPKIKEKLVSQAISKDERNSGSPLQWLNEKEQAVFEWLGRGLTTPEIARKLNVSTAAVEGCRARIRDKLGLPDAHALNACALQWESHSKDGRAMRRGMEMLWRRE
ncbi:MAG TPA: response regulator transcription factor [Prosthecobacter sp.]|nr:response regulator transcription factor [Prosthecobacter sp.]